MKQTLRPNSFQPRKGRIPPSTALTAVAVGVIFVLLGCSLFSPTPVPLIFPTLVLAPQPSALPELTAAPPPPPPGQAGGKIAFTCQVFRVQAADQICLMNSDGSGFRRLTTDDSHRHFYPSIAADGQSVVYVSNASGKKDPAGNVYYDIYEMNIGTGEVRQVTSELGILTAPEVSPDGTQIVFTNSDGPHEAVWLMGRDGSNPHRIFGSDTVSGWDPTWSPDGKQILFASTAPEGGIQLFIMNADGTSPRQASNLPNLRGRSDWSVRNQISTYSGEAWAREIFIFSAENPAATQVSPAGGNGQGPSFSPDGNWIAFTAYYGHLHEADGCEIYIMRIDGTDLTRLTENTYCDWQPRWGP